MTPQHVSVIAPIARAIERVKIVLFQPFDAGKWFVIGFCAWLAQLVQGGSRAGFNFNTGTARRSAAANVQHWFEQARDYAMHNLWWIVPVAAAVVLLGLVVWVLLTWLSSRGQFMFLHCVALNLAAVREPWDKFAREGNSLFVFRLLLGLATAVLTLPLVAGIALLVARMVGHGAANASGILAAAGLAMLAMLGWLTRWVIAKLTIDFLVPIQFARGGTCRAAWHVLIKLLSRDVGAFILYFLFQIVLAIAVFALLFAIVLATCCVAGCLFALPYLGTVLLLPVLIFWRSYSVCYLAQFGPEYEVLR